MKSCHVLAGSVCLFCLFATGSFASVRNLERRPFLGDKRAAWLSALPRGGGEGCPDESQRSDIKPVLEWANTVTKYYKTYYDAKEKNETHVTFLAQDALLKQDYFGAWGCKKGTNVTERVYAKGGLSEVLMEIPPKLVISSTHVDGSLKKLARKSLERHSCILACDVSEFCLFLVLLQETAKGSDSFWYPYIQFWPKKMASSIYWDDEEREYANKLPLKSYMNRVDKKLNVYQNALRDILPHKYNDELVRWVFSIMNSRAWVASYKDKDGDDVMNLVCLGDLFNHRSNGSVFVEQGSIEDAVLMMNLASLDDDSNDEHFLNYGHEHFAPRFPVVYGFCDMSLDMLPATSIINSFSSYNSKEVEEKALALGFMDYKTIAFRVEDGAIPDRVVDAMLYFVILRDLYNGKNPSEIIAAAQDLKMVESLFASTNDTDALNDMHHKYAKKVWFCLFQEADNVLSKLGPVPQVNEKFLAHHPHWTMLTEYHQLLLSVYEKVRRNAMRAFARVNSMAESSE